MLTLLRTTLNVLPLLCLVAVVILTTAADRRRSRRSRRRAVEAQLALVDHTATMARVSQRLTTLGFR